MILQNVLENKNKFERRFVEILSVCVGRSRQHCKESKSYSNRNKIRVKLNYSSKILDIINISSLISARDVKSKIPEKYCDYDIEIMNKYNKPIAPWSSLVLDPGPGFYSRLFLMEKATEGWRTVIDLSHLNEFVLQTPFKMETVTSVLLSIRAGDFLASIDLEDAYFQIPVHQSSRKLLRSLSEGGGV